MTPRQAFEQIRDYAAHAASAYPASPNIALIQEVCERMLAGEQGGPAIAQPTFWAAWHPQHGFEVPHEYEGAVAYADLDPIARKVCLLNAHDKTTNRTGWRATKVALVKVTS